MIGAEFAKRRDIRKLKSDALRVAAVGGAPRGQKLASLSASDLRDRFYSWRDVSGQRYVCSVFTDAERAIVAGFSAAAIIGVASDGGSRRPVCVLSSREFRALEGGRDGPASCGANEWHVHFSADECGVRDLAASLLN